MSKILAGLLVLAPALGAQIPPYDLLLKGGHVIDPKNKVDAPMDVAIANGRIARSAPNLPANQARKTVDVSGLTVTPVMSTWNPAREIKRRDLGHLDVGAEADVAVVRVDRGKVGFTASAGAANAGDQLIVAELTLCHGRVVRDLNCRASEQWRSFRYDKRRGSGSAAHRPPRDHLAGAGG